MIERMQFGLRNGAAIALAMLLCFAVPGPLAADFDQGWSAYQRGDFATALKTWIPLADSGDPVV